MRNDLHRRWSLEKGDCGARKGRVPSESQESVSKKGDPPAEAGEAVAQSSDHKARTHCGRINALGAALQLETSCAEQNNRQKLEISSHW